MNRLAPVAPVLIGAAAGALYVRERRERLATERFGAATLETLLNAIDANNPDTGAHVRRVAEYSLMLADAAGLDERRKRSIERVALFHDIGKLDGAISDIIDVSKRLTPRERIAVRKHPQRGADVLRPLAAFYPELPIAVLSHHERWDGSGYPRGLRGRRIPIEARVVAIADTFDAVTHARSYSPARSIEVGIEVIAAGSGTQFDPDFAELFLSPPVIDCVKDSMLERNAPRRKGGTRRGKSAANETPDITFRWRTPTALRQRAGL
ncbi:MAG: HD domain-containing phosphohydrolase [Gemmatimonadales bacterium]